MLKVIVFIMLISGALALQEVECATYRVDTKEELAELSLTSGDTVELLGGEWFRTKLDVVSGVTYKSYGNGKAIVTPAIDGKIIELWSDQGSNIWLFTVDSIDVGGDIGLVVYNLYEPAPFREFDAGQLDTQGEFYYSNGNLLVYSASNPANYYSNIDICPKIDVIDGGNIDSVSIVNLDLRYSSAHCIGLSKQSNILIEGNTISYIGGATLTGSLRTDRYGNGIELWSNATNCMVRNNVVHDIFDAGLTVQTITANQSISNVSFLNNIVYNCGLDGFEMFWSGEGNSIDGLYVNNNTFINTAGHGFGNRAERGGNRYIGSIGIYSTLGPISNFEIKNNIMYEDTITDENGPIHLSRCIFIGGAGVTEYSDIVFDNNVYYRESGQMMLVLGSTYNYDEFNDYKTEKNKDSHSISSDPQLYDTYKIKSTSPCRDAGDDSVNISHDFLNRPRNGVTDIGAYEYWLTLSGNGAQ